MMAAPGTPSSSGRTRRSPAASGHRLLALGLAVTILRAPLAAGDATTGLPRTGRCPDELASFDRLLAAFMDEHEVPGASLAVVRGSRLVAARGYGWADRERTEPVRPDSLFRIASISKPITAAAVMQLAERRKLDLDARILDVIGAAGAARAADEREGPGAAGAASAADGAEAAGAAAERDAAGAAGSRKAAGDTGGEKAGAETSAADGREAGGARDPRWDRITIRRLLQHTGGFDRDASFDPMFRSVQIARELGKPPPAMPADIIASMLRRPLDFDPGTRYAYSNFGYSLLGRAIEAASGTSYESYVRESVLAPLGMRRMRLGRTLPEGRAEGEVEYIDSRGRAGPSVFDESAARVPRPYGAWCLEAMDAHGGWIASAVDLARFAAAFDRPDECKILSRSSIDDMLRRPDDSVWREASGEPAPAYYACGWMVRPVDPAGKRRSIWHAGALDGSSTLLVRRHDGLGWAVLFNTDRGPGGARLSSAIDPLLHKAAAEVKRWPEIDLFEE